MTGIEFLITLYSIITIIGVFILIYLKTSALRDERKLTNKKRRKIMNLLARFYHADKLDIALNEKFF